jgi:hypothetical protein
VTMYDFTGIADGQPWPSPWITAEYDPEATCTRDVQSEEGRLRNVVGNFTLETRTWAWIPFATAPVDWAVAFTLTETVTVDTKVNVLMGARSALPVAAIWNVPASGYFLELRYDGTGLVRLIKRVASVTTLLDSFIPGEFADRNAADGTSWVARLQVVTVGATVEVRAKVWPEDENEPEWDLLYVDAAADRITAAGACILGVEHESGGTTSQVIQLLVREAEIIDASTFDYSMPVLTATLDDTDYTADIAWTGTPGDYELVRQEWVGGGEPWL